MRSSFLLLAAASLAITGACKKSEPTADASDAAMADTGMASPDTMASGSMAGGDSAMAMGAQAFADKASASDMFEIESSKLAASMASSSAVKDFAKMMIAGHTKSTAELKAAAAKASPAVSVAPHLDAMQQADLDALKGAGAGFDKMYAAKQVAAHKTALALLKGYADSGDSAPLKAFAAKTAPVVEDHLDHAQKLPM